MSSEVASFGELLRAIRLGHNLYQRDIEDLTRQIAEREDSPDFIVRNFQLSSIEHGHSLPKPGKLLALAEIYGLSREQLTKLWAATRPRGVSQEPG